MSQVQEGRNVMSLHSGVTTSCLDLRHLSPGATLCRRLALAILEVGGGRLGRGVCRLYHITCQRMDPKTQSRGCLPHPGPRGGGSLRFKHRVRLT